MELRKLSLRLLLILTWALLISAAFAQDSKVTWSAKLVPEDARAGEAAQIVVTAKIAEGWHIYALQQPEEVTSTSFKISSGIVKASGDDAVMPFPILSQDDTIKKTVGKFQGEVAFGIPVKIDASAKGQIQVKIEATSQACDATSCLPPKTDSITFNASIAPGAARKDRLDAVIDEPEQPAGYVDPDSLPQDPPPTTKNPPANSASSSQNAADDVRSKPLGEFLVAAFVAGLLALLTPCVFPMLPVTVSYFSKRKEKSRFAGPAAYGVGIVATFTVVGLVTTALFGGAKVIDFATHPITNIALGLIFVVLALSLFGVFELQLPQGLVNKASSGRTKEGLIGPFMMGLTFSLTSFTCTVAFVGSLLAAASQGEYFYPLLGMLVFSITFAFPFFLLALFPKYLDSLPRAGSWMNTVKATMGFLELIAAIKFFQNADLVWQAGILTRPVFIALWSMLFIIAALYLFGWLILPKQAGEPVGWRRRTFAVAFALIGVWLMTGLNGQSLGHINAFLPPSNYGPGSSSENPNGQKHLTWLTTLEEGLAEAKKSGKKVIIDFTGYT